MKPLNDVMGFCCSVKNAFEITAYVLVEYMQIGWFYLVGPVRTFWHTSAFSVFSRNMLTCFFFLIPHNMMTSVTFWFGWQLGMWSLFGIVNS